MKLLTRSERIILRIWEFLYYVTWPLDELVSRIQAWLQKKNS